MYIHTPHLFIFVIVIISWCKAGLAGDWILNIANALTCFALFLGLKHNFSYKILFKCFGPLLIIILISTISFFNPSYRLLNENDWKSLKVEEAISNEQNIVKAEYTVKSLRNIYESSKVDKELTINLSINLKNEYYDKFKFEESSCDTLVKNYLNLINNKIINFLPSSVISHERLYIEFYFFIFQITFGIAAYICMNNLEDIRKVLTAVAINGGILSFAGVIQSITYLPSDNLKEIWGIWDTPEPRYFFASFTYKNHWSSFTILVISSVICLLYKKNQNENFAFILTLYFSLILLIISIPLSGSRSGIIFLLIFIILTLSFFRKRILFLSKTLLLFIIIFLSIFLASKTGRNKANEMITNTKNQINGLFDGNFPFRIMLWKDIVGQIQDKPLFGHGFNSYKAINPKYQSAEVYNERNKVKINSHHDFNPIVGYAHNDWLEKISEFGLVGSLPILVYLFPIPMCFISTRSITTKILLLGSMVFLIYAFVDFPTRTPCSFLLFSLIVGLALKYDFIIKKKYSK